MFRIKRILIPRKYLTLSQNRFNHYTTLGIERGATQEEIKKAHKAKAREYHPDRPGGNEDLFVLCQEAYEVLSNATDREAYDREVFGKSRDDAESEEKVDDQFYYKAPGVWKRGTAEHVSQSYQEGLNQFDRMERKFKRRIQQILYSFTYAKDKPLNAIVILLSCGALIYGFDQAVKSFTKWLCSDYIYQSGQRQYELPNTPGHVQKMNYIEKMISKLPEDRSEQYKLFGFRRDWLIEFYMQSTKAFMRGEAPTLQDAVRYIPFVGIDFLTGKIPLNPADDFRNDSVKCRLCEFIYGTIVKIYPAEYLEQHTQRSKEFLRVFLADKAHNQKQIAYKEEDPDWVDPVTGKKSVGGRQWRFIDQGYGDTIEGKEHVYGDVSYNIYRRRWNTDEYR